MQANEPNERRHATRYALRLPAIVRAADPTNTDVDAVSEVIDISAEGAFLRLDQPVSLGTDLKLVIGLGDGLKMAVQATVLRSGTTWLGVPGVALRFARAKFL
jgi:hypothetical protein